MSFYDLTANMYGMYNNQMAFNDLADTYTNPMFCGINPMMSMTGSIFGGNPMMCGMMYGNPEQYYKNYEKYQDFMIDNQVRQQQKMRNADLRLSSPQEGIAKQAGYLHDKIMRDEQEQIKQAYAQFVDSVKGMYGNGSEQEVADRASTLYQQLTGTSITEDIRKNGRGSFTQGVIQSLTLGFADGKTAEENVSAITGQPVGRKEETKKFLGNIAGGAIAGGGTGIALALLRGGKGLLLAPILGLAGAIAGGIFGQKRA